MQGCHRTKVLFVCVGNSCRSPMAEAIAARMASDVMEVSSAGLAPLGHVEPLTKTTLAKHGYSADALQSKALRAVDVEAADIVINMTGRPGLLVFGDASKLEDWAVEDPYGADAETYQRIFADIERRVARLVARVRESRSRELTADNIREGETGKP